MGGGGHGSEPLSGAFPIKPPQSGGNRCWEPRQEEAGLDTEGQAPETSGWTCPSHPQTQCARTPYSPLPRPSEGAQPTPLSCNTLCSWPAHFPCPHHLGLRTHRAYRLHALHSFLLLCPTQTEQCVPHPGPQPEVVCLFSFWFWFRFWFSEAGLELMVTLLPQPPTGIGDVTTTPACQPHFSVIAEGGDQVTISCPWAQRPVR